MAPPPKKRKELSDQFPDKCRKNSPEQTGLPDENSVLEEKPFTSPSGKKYRILRTSEVDDYEGFELPQRSES